MSSKLPAMARPLVAREMTAWACSAILLGALEGGLVGVIVKNAFANVAAPIWINLAVAIAAGTPAFSNLMSFVFAGLAQGRDKTRLVSLLLAIGSLSCLLMAVIPFTASGLAGLLVAMITARACWSGVITIRSGIWRMNFPRHVRARITGWIVTLSALLIALTSAGIGVLLDWQQAAFRLIYPLAALSGFLSAIIYRKTRVRRQAQLLAREQTDSGGGVQLRQIFAVLIEDREFRRYMLAMMVFGCGNLMLLAPLIIVLNEHFSVSQFEQVLITSSLPLLMVAISVTFWARLLDRKHILEYRARQGWVFAMASAIFVLATILRLEWLFWVGSLMWGIAFGGGVLGWNLGHNDYSSEEKSTLYMSVHVTLTGLRGLVMPAIAVLLYQWFSALNPRWGPYMLLLPFTLTTIGAIWFVKLANEHRQAYG